MSREYRHIYKPKPLKNIETFKAACFSRGPVKERHKAFRDALCAFLRSPQAGSTEQTPLKQKEKRARQGPHLRFAMSKWRRRWDSNPRNALTFNGFQDRRNRPLCHSSGWVLGVMLGNAPQIKGIFADPLGFHFS